MCRSRRRFRDLALVSALVLASFSFWNSSGWVVLATSPALSSCMCVGLSRPMRAGLDHNIQGGGGRELRVALPPHFMNIDRCWPRLGCCFSNGSLIPQSELYPFGLLHSEDCQAIFGCVEHSSGGGGGSHECCHDRHRRLCCRRGLLWSNIQE
jgi:hypothetical protein